MKSKYVVLTNLITSPIAIYSIILQITSIWPLLRTWIHALYIADNEEMVAVIQEIVL